MKLSTYLHPRPAASAVLVLVSALAIAAPAGAGGLDGVGGPLADAEGDAYYISPGGSGPLIDLALTDISYDGDSMRIELSFFTPISSPTTLQPNGLFGVLELDVDQDDTTGQAPAQNQGAPPLAFIPAGWEFGIAFQSELFSPFHRSVPGFVGLMDFRDCPCNPGNPPPLVALIPITYTPTGVSLQFPLSYLDDDDGLINFSVSVGNMTGPTDAADAMGTSYFATCAADVNGDGAVDIVDLIAVIVGWGTEAGDITGDSMTDVSDLIALISAWGLCS